MKNARLPACEEGRLLEEHGDRVLGLDTGDGPKSVKGFGSLRLAEVEARWWLAGLE